MGAGEFVKLKCGSGTLQGLATSLKGFGPAGGTPDWLVSGVWLCTDRDQYLATATVEVLPDGVVARTLCVSTPEELVAHVDAEVPDLSARLRARGNGIDLPDAATAPAASRSLEAWPSGRYSMSVLVRASQRGSSVNRISCGLLFRNAKGQSLLVAADTSTLAMVLSEDEELIGRYLHNCEELSPADYVALTAV